MRNQQPVEMILFRQVASYLAIPVWMMDDEGNLAYYNEPAEALLGIRFDDVGPVHADKIGDVFEITDLDGDPLPDHDLPIVQALETKSPHHRDLRFRRPDNGWRDISVTAIPIEGQGERFVGVFATFWEIKD
jgi:PAS domain-containing protein